VAPGRKSGKPGEKKENSVPEDRHGETPSEQTGAEAETNAVEARLREALSMVSPRSMPTIGVREAIVEAVRVRRRNRQRVAMSLAGCCVLIAAAAITVTSLDLGKPSESNSAAAQIARGAAARPSSPPRAEFGDATPGCAEIAIGSQPGEGCAGVFSSEPEFGTNGTEYDAAASAVPRVSPSGPGSSGRPTRANTDQKGDESISKKASGTAGLGKSGSNPGSGVSGGYEIVVPVGAPVRIVLRDSPGEVWTSPAIGSGQGTGAAAVRTLSPITGGAGSTSTAIFESPDPVTVALSASELRVCGSGAVCGTPTKVWFVVLEFQRS
jgi:hypothetical protein